ncbi:MAG: penicillin-binding protein 2 [Verrucomicrobiota bacterium]
MLIFDQLKKNDPPLRMVALVIFCGLGLLIVGLWWVQIVSVRDYQANLITQSFRTVRIPAVRGKILDRTGTNDLAANRPTYNISLYLEELRKPFEAAYFAEITRVKNELKEQSSAAEKKLNRKLTKEEKKQFTLSSKDKAVLRQKARYEVASNVVVNVSQRLQQPVSLDATNFERHYLTRLALPYPVATNLNTLQIARFEEQSTTRMGVDLEVQSTRVYPYQTVASHVLGCLKLDPSSAEGEEAFFSYRLPDYRGMVGVEAGYDQELRGKAGAKSVVVNNIGFRQRDNVWTPAEAGENVVLTIDLRVQQKTERALARYGPATRGAAVVMDVQTGDILAMASSPTLNPNHFIEGFPSGEWKRITDLRAQWNRATQENYPPGSIFKTVTGLACLEAGLDPNETINNPGYFQFRTGGKRVKDLAAPGPYNLKKAIVHSSNTYFIENGLKAGIINIVQLGQKLHFGERPGLHTYQETPGRFPSLKRVTSNWRDGDTANVCIGQGEVDVSPLQVSVLMSAIANGGKVLKPRLVDRVEPLDPALGVAPIIFPKGVVRNELGVKPRNLEILREAMLADVEEGGTGAKAAVPGLAICGKTGTAQVMDPHGKTIADITWFASFAPFEKPHYAVVVMIETEVNAGSGGTTCAPIAGSIYRALLESERGSQTERAQAN